MKLVWIRLGCRGEVAWHSFELRRAWDGYALGPLLFSFNLKLAPLIGSRPREAENQELSIAADLESNVK